MRSVPLLLTLVMLVPASHAFEAQTDAPERPLVVDEPWSGELVVHVPCDEALASPTRTITWSAESDAAGIVVTGPESRVVDPAGCVTENTVVETFPFDVTATRDAPGETPIQITFRVEMDDASQEVMVAMQVAFLGNFTARPVGETTQRDGPQKEIVYEVEVENLGNARSVFRFHLDTQDAEGHPVVPGEIVLGSPVQGAEMTKAVVRFQYATPFENGQNDVTEDVTLRITAHSTKYADVQAEQEETLTFTAQTKGFYIPGPGLLVLLAAVALGARLRRV